MFARGAFSFHPAGLSAFPENLLSPIIPAHAKRARKSNHSHTYGIPGGGGCTGLLVRPVRRVSKPFVSPTYAHFGHNFCVSPTYAKTRGYTPCGKCRRADIFDFSPYFLRYFANRSKITTHPSALSSARSAGQKRRFRRVRSDQVRSSRLFRSPLATRHSPLPHQSPRLLRQRLLSASSAPEILSCFRQRVDWVVILVAAIQRFGVVRFNSRAVILCPVGNAQLPVVLLHLVHPALADKRHIANDTWRGESGQVAHDVVLQLLRFMDRQ